MLLALNHEANQSIRQHRSRSMDYSIREPSLTVDHMKQTYNIFGENTTNRQVNCTQKAKKMSSYYNQHNLHN